MPNLVYEGTVSSWDKKADGTQLIIGKGDRKGEPYYKLSFQVDGEYVNLMDFDGITGGQKGEYRVEYYQKFLPNGEPDLYPKNDPNGKPQYALVDITPLGARNGPNPAPAAAQATPTPQQGGKADFDKDLSARQTAADKATRLINHEGSVNCSEDARCEWGMWFDYIYERLTGKPADNDLDLMLAAAKDKLDAEDDSDSVPF